MYMYNTTQPYNTTMQRGSHTILSLGEGENPQSVSITRGDLRVCPQKFLRNKYSEVDSEAILKCSSTCKYQRSNNGVRATVKRKF